MVDGARVELGLWRACAERFIGPSIDDAIDTFAWLQDKIDERTDWLLDHQKRKITPDTGFPVFHRQRLACSRNVSGGLPILVPSQALSDRNLITQ
jgi:hypothetical protein